MNRLKHHLPPKTVADLQELVEPLASYISAVDRPRLSLIAALIMLLDYLQQINEAANAQIASFRESGGE